jgi:hypothetical protein
MKRHRPTQLERHLREMLLVAYSHPESLDDPEIRGQLRRLKCVIELALAEDGSLNDAS